MAGSTRKTASKSSAPPPSTYTEPDDYASPNHDYQLQLTMQLQKTVASLETKIDFLTSAITKFEESVEKRFDKNESKLESNHDKLDGKFESLQDKVNGQGWVIKTAGVVLTILLSTGVFLLNKGIDIGVALLSNSSQQPASNKQDSKP